MSDKATPPTRPDSPTEARSPVRIPAAAVMVILAVLGIIALVAVLRMDVSGQRGSGLSERFQLDIEDYMTVDPVLIGYDEQGGFATGMKIVRGIAAGPDGHVLVVGDQRLATFDAAGRQVSEIPFSGKPTCIAVAGTNHVVPDRRFVGVDNRIELYDASGTKLATWENGLDDKSVLTSIAVGEEEVFAADAGHRVVLRFDADGQLLNPIGTPDEQRGVRGFVIPSAYFDVATGDDGLLRVANPGARRIETYTPEGDLLGQWGKASSEIDGFFGCCNPSHFVLLPNGRIVTSEKGIPRIKIYAGQGELKCVVAEPRQLAHTDTVAAETRDEHQLKAFDIAVDTAGRILVLDPTSAKVRVFEAKAEETGGET